MVDASRCIGAFSKCLIKVTLRNDVLIQYLFTQTSAFDKDRLIIKLDRLKVIGMDCSFLKDNQGKSYE